MKLAIALLAVQLTAIRAHAQSTPDELPTLDQMTQALQLTEPQRTAIRALLEADRQKLAVIAKRRAAAESKLRADLERPGADAVKVAQAIDEISGLEASARKLIVLRRLRLRALLNETQWKQLRELGTRPSAANPVPVVQADRRKLTLEIGDQLPIRGDQIQTFSLSITGVIEVRSDGENKQLILVGIGAGKCSLLLTLLDGSHIYYDVQVVPSTPPLPTSSKLKLKRGETIDIPGRDISSFSLSQSGVIEVRARPESATLQIAALARGQTTLLLTDRGNGQHTYVISVR